MGIFKLSALAVVLATIGPVSLVACGSGQGKSATEAVGSVTLSLTGVSPNGITYRLRNGTFSVTGPQNVTLSTETNPDASTISRELPAGNYLIRLKTGWTMERFNGTSFETVEAILLSPNPAGFAISDQAHTAVVFQFRAGDDVIQLGNGVLDVSIDIDDGATTCVPGQVMCGAACVDLNSDPHNCGSCGTVCASGASCTAGICATNCNMGMVDCNGDGVCESDLDFSNTNCGMCGNVCPAGTVCTGGACTACPMGGVCAGGPCGMGFADCDGNMANGCETDIRTSPLHCGSCGTSCPAGQSCTSGTCVLICTPGLTNCLGSCVNLNSDNAHCGLCGNACVGSQVCTNGFCQ